MEFRFDANQEFHVKTVKAVAVGALALKKDDLFIWRGAALTDGQAANMALQCTLKTL